MILRTSILGLTCGVVLAGSLASMTGCDSSDETAESTTSAETIRSASVALTIEDESGARIGEGAGILIAPRMVLTSAHLVAGKTKWSVKTTDGKIANGVRGVTYDWLAYDDSEKAHPRKHDVAVIYLDRPIRLADYPTVSQNPIASNGSAARTHGVGAAFTTIPSTFTKLSTFPNAYITEQGKGETLQTGGAVLDDHNHIVGVTTGRGLTTGKLYVARVDGLTSWVTTQTTNCDSGKSDPPDEIVVKTYQPPPSSSTSSSSGSTTSSSGSTTSSSGSTTSSSGTSGTTSSSGSTTSSSGTSGTTSSSGSTTSSSGTSGTTSSSGSTTSSSGSTSSSSGTIPTCHEETNGHCYGSTCGTTTSSSSSGSSSGSSGFNTIPNPSSSSTSGNNGSSTSSGNGSSSGSSGFNTIPNPSSSSTSGNNGSSTSSGNGSSSSSGSSGLNPIPASPANPSSTSGNNGSSTSSSSGGPDDNSCEGPKDDPVACPPEDDGCLGKACGGGNPDDLIDYGGCGGCGGSGGGGDDKIH